jgi:uncharacterized protein (TIGR00251 family)
MDFEPKNSVKICAKPNKKKTSIIGFDENRKAWLVEVKAPAQDGRANQEIVKFFSKKTKKKVTIKSGLTSKEKILLFK